MIKYKITNREIRRADYIQVFTEYTLTEKDLQELREGGLSEDDPDFEKTIQDFALDWFEFTPCEGYEELNEIGEFLETMETTVTKENL